MSDLTAILVDTNIFVYSYDFRDRAKQERAESMLEQLVRDQRAVVSAQCLTEFYNAATRRLPDRMPHQDALAQVQKLADVCRVLPLTESVVLEGCRGCGAYQLSLWDALIWAVAKLNQIPYVLTEDAPHGRVLEGVTFLNPFHPGFDPTVLGVAS